MEWHCWEKIKLSVTSETMGCWPHTPIWFYTLTPTQNGRHFANDIFKCNFVNEKTLMVIKKSLKIVSMGHSNSIAALFQIMVRHKFLPILQTFLCYQFFVIVQFNCMVWHTTLLLHLIFHNRTYTFMATVHFSYLAYCEYIVSDSSWIYVGRDALN